MFTILYLLMCNYWHTEINFVVFIVAAIDIGMIEAIGQAFNKSEKD